MSRIGRKPINIPAGVNVKVDGNVITVKGAKATLTQKIHPNMTVTVDGDVINVTRPNDEKENRSLHGLTRSLIQNMVIGVTDGFKKELDVNGVGYRVQKQGKNLVMNLGFSHQVTVSEICLLYTSPVTPWGKPALGYKTRKHHNRSDKFIVKRRNGK